jgi:hypothetical protein
MSEILSKNDAVFAIVFVIGTQFDLEEDVSALREESYCHYQGNMTHQFFQV